MKNLKNKLNKKGGFTLIEMLIVVAIIAILVAVSIPLINGALERTRIATDAANERAAKAEAVIAYLSDELDVTTGIDFEANTPYYYNAAEGSLSATTISAGYGRCENHKGDIIAIKVGEDGVVSIAWIDAGTETTAGATGWNTGLCGDELN